jgi:trehalose 6-phosphate synthase
VHDYQLHLVPALLRALRPDLRIGFFLHIPLPPQELFMQLPWRQQIVEGMLGADLVGFQRPVAAQNFMQICRRLVDVQPARAQIPYQGRTVRVGAFPVSIDFGEIDAIAALPETGRAAAELRKALGSPRRVLLGVDRLDYTKGIDVRLQAFRELLQSGVTTAGETVLVQVATPSRERVTTYRQLRERVERAVGRINGEFGRLGHPAIHYQHHNLPREDLCALYAAADVMLVTPLRDGMNLVCKEYVAARHRGGGVLVLSEFAGAAGELRQALLVNPHDVVGLRETIARAISLPDGEARRRMRELRRQVRTHDVHRFARTFLEALEEHTE